MVRDNWVLMVLTAIFLTMLTFGLGVLAQEAVPNPLNFNNNYRNLNESKKREMNETKVNLQQNLLSLGQLRKIHLIKGMPQTFFYIDQSKYSHSFSVLVIPCSGVIRWSVNWVDPNSIINPTDILSNNDKNSPFVYNGSNPDLAVINNTTGHRMYSIVINAIEKNSPVEIFISEDSGGLYEMSVEQRANLRTVLRKRRRLSVKWSPRNLNTKYTKYCLVVSTARQYNSYCGVEEEKKTRSSFLEKLTFATQSREFADRRKRRRKNSGVEQINDDAAMICVENNTKLTVPDMTQNQTYFLSLFAINTITNLSVLYGTTSVNYKFRVARFQMRDGKRTIIRKLSKYEGAINFWYKATRSIDDLQIYALVCGGSINVTVKRIRKPEESVLEVVRVDGYKRFVIPEVLEGDRIVLKVRSLDLDDELDRIKYVEVFASSQPENFPMPVLPDDLRVHEYKSKRNCTSVTIGWQINVDSSNTKYCVRYRENKKRDYEDIFRRDFQCHLDDRIFKKERLSSAFFRKQMKKFSAPDCGDIKSPNLTLKPQVTIYTLQNLEPGKSYAVQITARKHNGRTLAYKLLTVHTKKNCDESYQNT